jgi:hypothetical protein
VIVLGLLPQVHELRMQERRIITSEDYTHILGRRAKAVPNGMATAIFLVDFDASRERAQSPDWLPFAPA